MRTHTTNKGTVMNPNMLIGAFAMVIAPVVIAAEAIDKAKTKIANHLSNRK